jgi:hypothetical protein
VRHAGVVFLVGLAASSLAAGCRDLPAGSNDESFHLDWRIAPDPPRVGPLRISLDLTDAATGHPLGGARLRIEGDMSHPGMPPVLAKAREVAPGRYEAPFELGMAGDWVLLVDAVLSDGRRLHRQIDLPGVRAR